MVDSRIAFHVRGMSVALAACLALLAGSVYAGGEVRTKKAREAEIEAKEKPVIVRYTGCRPVKILRDAAVDRGQPKAQYVYGLAVRIADLSGRKVTTVYYPNNGPEFVAFVKALKGGEIKKNDYLKVSVRAEKGPGDIPLLKSAEGYDYVPGEQREGVYVYQGQGLRSVPEARGAVLAVKARKLGEDYELLAPAPKGKSRNASGPLPSSIKPGEPFLASVKTVGERHVLRKAAAYTPPEEGVLKEVKTTMVGGRTYQAVVVAQGEKNAELLLPNKARYGRQHAALSSAVAGIEPGEPVAFLADPLDGGPGKLVLKAIEPAPVIPNVGQIVAITDVLFTVRMQKVSSSPGPTSHVNVGTGANVDVNLPRVDMVEVATSFAVPCIVPVSQAEARAAGLIN